MIKNKHDNIFQHISKIYEGWNVFKTKIDLKHPPHQQGQNLRSNVQQLAIRFISIRCDLNK